MIRFSGSEKGVICKWDEHEPVIHLGLAFHRRRFEAANHDPTLIDRPNDQGHSAGGAKATCYQKCLDTHRHRSMSMAPRAFLTISWGFPDLTRDVQGRQAGEGREDATQTG